MKKFNLWFTINAIELIVIDPNHCDGYDILLCRKALEPY